VKENLNYFSPTSKFDR